MILVCNGRVITHDENNPFIENGAVLISDTAKKSLLMQWQKRKQEAIVHPFTGEKMQWGMVIYTQAQLLARYIRGDIDAYPPLMWK